MLPSLLKSFTVVLLSVSYVSSQSAISTAGGQSDYTGYNLSMAGDLESAT
jgi:hypothetical protein